VDVEDSFLASSISSFLRADIKLFLAPNLMLFLAGRRLGSVSQRAVVKALFLTGSC
jgi:hypothetical protein